MSGLINSSVNGSASNNQDGQSFSTSFPAQSGAVSLVFHHSGSIQGLHNVHGSFNVPNMTSTLTSRNSSINSAPFGAVQQPAGSLPSGRFTSANILVPLSQISHGNTHGHSGITNRGGMSVVGDLGYGDGKICWIQLRGFLFFLSIAATTYTTSQ